MAAPAAAPSSTSSLAPQDEAKVPILVKFKASASASNVEAATRASGGQKVRDIAQLRTRVINVPANAAERIREAMAQNAAVERADIAVEVEISDGPNDPDYA